MTAGKVQPKALAASRSSHTFKQQECQKGSPFGLWVCGLCSSLLFLLRMQHAAGGAGVGDTCRTKSAHWLGSCLPGARWGLLQAVLGLWLLRLACLLRF